MRLASMLSAAVAAVALFAAPGCTRAVTGRPVAGALLEAAPAPTTFPTLEPPPPPKDGVCKKVSAPLSLIEAHSPDEPVLRIPQPSGWQRTSVLDSDVIRFAMGDRGLAADAFMPTTVVTLESQPGANQDQQKIIDQERAMLVNRLGVTNLRKSDTTQCGQRAQLVSYDAPALDEIPPRKARTLIVVAAFSGNTYAATVTVQAADPDVPTYRSDAHDILTGFQLLPPGAG